MMNIRKNIDYVVEFVRDVSVLCSLILASLFFEVSTGIYPLSGETTALIIGYLFALISILFLLRLDMIYCFLWAAGFYVYNTLSSKDLPADYFLSNDGKGMLVSSMVLFVLANWTLVREK